MAAAVLAWLSRRQIARAGSRLGDFLNAHRELAQCHSELTNQAESFERQKLSMTGERDYLMAALRELIEAGGLVARVHKEGLLVTSESLPNKPSSSPTNSSTLPLKPE
jgi:hypothetical protein